MEISGSFKEVCVRSTEDISKLSAISVFAFLSKR